MKKNLIIWDFDGVIADTEKIWLKNKQFLLKSELGVDWDWKTINYYLLGISDKTKKEILDNLGIITDDSFWRKSIEMDTQSMINEGFPLTDGIEDIFKLSNIKQCIATGGRKDKTALKIDVVNIRKYFPENNVFTADMVQRGKPEPDLFLLAAEKMGETPETSVVIEDSIAGLTAAIKANILPIAFLGGELRDNKEHLQKVKDLGIKHIFHTMSDLRDFLLTLFI